MAVPALRIPVSMDLAALRDQANQARQSTAETLKIIGRGFNQLNSQIVGQGQQAAFAYAQSWTRAGARIALGIGVAFAGFKVAGALIDEVREQIEKMVSIADKSQATGLRPEFFQAFIAAAKGAKDVVEDLEGALKNLFDATKEKLDLNRNIGEIETYKVQASALADSMREIRMAFGVEGAGQFLNAQGNDQRALAVLQTMQQLIGLGERLEAMDLGERAFGGKFIDNLRTGKLTLDEMVKTIEEKLSRGVADGSIFSDETVRKAKEVDDKLKDAYRTLEENLHPSMERLAVVVLGIRSLWADIVGLIAKAATLMPKANAVPIETLRAQEANLKNQLADKGLTSSQRSGKEAQLREIQSKLAQGEASLVPEQPILAPTSPNGVPLPPMRPLNAPQPSTPAATGSDRDRLDSSIEAIQRRTAGIEAEARNMDLLTQAREKARIAAELETVAMQVNKEAGLGANVVTDEQRARIDAVAEAYGRAQAAIENARSPLATFARESANVGKALNQFAAQSLDGMTDALADVVTGTKTAAEAFRNMANQIIGDLARIAIRQAITGPIASALGGFPGIGSIFGGARATGGPVEAGKAYLVNENTPRSELFVPGVSGMIVPNNPAAGSGGGIVVSITSAPVFQAGMTPADIAAIEGRLQQNNIELRQQVQADLRNAIRLDHDTLTRS